MTALFYVAIFFFLLLCGLLCLVILIQESKSLGLGASFGGDGGGDSLFGTSTAAVLKKFTGYLALIFVVACLFLSLWSARISQAKVAPPGLMLEESQSQQGT